MVPMGHGYIETAAPGKAGSLRGARAAGGRAKYDGRVTNQVPGEVGLCPLRTSLYPHLSFPML